MSEPLALITGGWWVLLSKLALWLKRRATWKRPRAEAAVREEKDDMARAPLVALHFVVYGRDAEDGDGRVLGQVGRKGEQELKDGVLARRRSIFW